MDWLRRQKRLLDPSNAVRIQNVTPDYTALNLIGPLAESVLRAVSDSPLDKDSFR